MNSTLRYILLGLGIASGILCLWYFGSIVVYIIISLILALIGKPIVEVLGKIKIKKYAIPKWTRALVTLLFFWVLFFAFFRFFIPLIITEIDKMSEINPQEILTSLQEPIKAFEAFIEKYQIAGKEHFTVENFISQKALAFFNMSFLTSIINSFASILGNIFIAFFSISFITFFFLKDETLFAESILSIVPDKHVEAFSHAMISTRRLLLRYFVGIIGQLTGIFTLVALGLTIAGVGLSHSLIIALLAALVNIVPYIGPLVGSTIGVIIGVATHLDMDFYHGVLPLIGWMVLVFVIVHLIDNIFFQPLIFSNSVNAHPLEIFLVLMVAGSLGGIVGMMVAIPSYTVLRVFAKEFFNNFKVVKKLTKNID